MYNISRWSDGYFEVSPEGHVTHDGVALDEIVSALNQQGLSMPLVLRFTDILQHRTQALCQAFDNALQNEAHYTAVYPIKVNQEPCVVNAIVNTPDCRTGLEAGSKAELLVVMATAKPGEHVIICNGYKDKSYIELALMGLALGHQIYIILEKMSELPTVLAVAEAMGVTPLLGVRVRLASIGKGNWQNTGGAKSKFGLTTSQILEVIDTLKNRNLLSSLQILHCHLGSQIANIRDIQNGMQECAQFYVELIQLGVPIHTVDIGGGLGVDYEGTGTRSYCSMNYTLQEYANKVVHVLKEACAKRQCTMPNIISESGRALAAHHAVLITQAIDIEKIKPASTASTHSLAQEMQRCLAQMGEQNTLEIYHDAKFALSEAHQLFCHGGISLHDKAAVEQLFLQVAFELQSLLKPEIKSHQAAIEDLEQRLADKIFMNFSLFQSIPDAWALEQIFPIMPIKGVASATRRAVLQDITCDSDGRINHYVDGQTLENTLPLPATEEPLILGTFMVGAYQETLGDIHNLFGEVNTAEVKVNNNQFEIVSSTEGQSVKDVLAQVHYDQMQLMQSFETLLQNVDQDKRETYKALIVSGFRQYSYLESVNEK